MLAAEGLNVCALLVEAEIDAGSLEVSGARIATQKISRLWELAAERSGNPAIGLAQHHVARPASFEVVGYAMMSCANLLAAFECLGRHVRIIGDAATNLTRDERGRFRVTVELSGGERPVPRQRMEFILITLLTFCRWISGHKIRPTAVALAYPPPADPAPYRAAFRCPVFFDAPASSLLFAHKDVALPLPTSAPSLAQLHERLAGQYLERALTSSRAHDLIVRLLPEGEPRRDQVAHALHMSERTLQRRLDEQATSFLKLLDDTRRELAEQYLGREQLSLGQVAYLLGFADRSSFFRACRRWFKVPPGKYRSRLRRDPTDAAPGP